MTDERLRQLCDFMGLLDKHEIDAEVAKIGHEMLDEIRRLRRQLDEATTDRDAWELKARSLAAESCRVHYANPDYLNAKGDE